MKVAKWGNSLAVRIPRDVQQALGLAEGDDVELKPADSGVLEIGRAPSVEDLLAGIRRLARPLPSGWTFDRDEANAR